MEDAVQIPAAGGFAQDPSGAGAPLRVLVTSYRSAPHVGGQGVYVRELVRGLLNQGAEVSVASGPPYPELGPELEARAELIRLPSLDLFEEENAFLALRWRHLRDKAARTEWLAHNTGAFAEMTSFALRLERVIAATPGRFDVIHDNQTLSLPMARIDAALPVITTLHHPIAIDRDFAVAGAGAWWRKLLARRWHDFVKTQARAARRLEHFLAVSDAARRGYAERCGVDSVKVRVAFNGIDHESFTVDPAVPREPGLIAAVASADVPVKGLDVLIAALARLKRKDLRLVVVGRLRDGPTRRALEASGLADQVEFRSGLTREEIAELFRRASLFVSASRFEGFGFPPAEAMACGCPVIVSDGGALPEVAGEAGIVTPVGDSTALAEAIASVMDDPERRAAMSKAGAERARAAFCWDKHAAAAIALYRDALKARARS